MQCPKCQKAGFIRLEHIITGLASRRAFYCGVCEHTWVIEETPGPLSPRPFKFPAPVKPKTRRFGPKR